jgi:hypothetical protein
MKNLICLLTVFLAVACSPGGSPFEKTISDYKQTDPKTGKLYRLKFKMIEMGEPKKITVADSLEVLEAKYKGASFFSCVNDIFTPFVRNPIDSAASLIPSH